MNKKKKKDVPTDLKSIKKNSQPLKSKSTRYIYIYINIALSNNNNNKGKYLIKKTT